MVMRLEEVKTERDERSFLEMPMSIYLNDPNYIRPLDSDIRSVFHPEKNGAYANGACNRWLLVGDDEKPVGRIAAFYDRAIANTYEQPTGGIGFFECIDDESAAALLFGAAREWLQEQGMEAMDGPINFGSRERWWGLLVDGWHAPCYGANYHPPYYRRLFEAYGFQLYFRQFTFRRRLDKALDGRLDSLARRLMFGQNYVFRHIRKSELPLAPGYFREVYNKAWGKHPGVRPLSEGNVRDMMKAMRPILDVKALWFAFHNDVPVAFFIATPDANELLVQYGNGKVGIKALCYFLLRKNLRLCRTLLGLVFGVVPEHQRKGVELALIAAAAKALCASGYQELQMSWIGDFNPKMVNLCRKIGADIYKTHHTYRYLFDRQKKAQRHAVI